MLDPSIQKYLNQFLAGKLGCTVSSLEFRSHGGGSINDCYRVVVNRATNFFLKINSRTTFPSLFEKENHGLQFLAANGPVRVPAVILFGEVSSYQFLLLEWIEGGLKTDQFWKRFGEQLAAQHRVTESCFGLTEDNYMGALPQSNTEEDTWVYFFPEHRLRPQIKLARDNRLLEPRHITQFEELCRRLAGIFEAEKPALLHGDLWSGNFICNQTAEPVLVDPAVYFGHRSVDLAMTTLFGGFDSLFYEAYNDHFSFPGNYREQWEICNLYPLLIHLNLFGAGYLREIESILRKFS